MATGASIEARRRGFWLRVARERANLSQETVAKELGLSTRSKSTLSAWEAGSRDPKLRYLSAMARLYEVPVTVFMEPAPTATEQLEDRLAGLARDAIAAGLRDAEAEAASARAADGLPGGRPDTRVA